MISPYFFVGLCRGESGITPTNMDNMPSELVEAVLHKRLSATPRNELIETCISIACEHYGTTRDALYGKCRNADLVETRYAVMYIIWRYFNVKKKPLSKYLGLDNSTCHHGINKVSNRVEDDPEFENEIKTIANKVRIKEKERLITHPITNENKI